MEHDGMGGADPAGADEPSGAHEHTASGRPGINVQQILAQLQSMIEQVATASTPALREVAAKAAELAAAAAARTGPLAHTIADKTEQAGLAVAGRARGFAAGMRSPEDAADTPGPTESPAATTAQAASVEQAAAEAGTAADVLVGTQGDLDGVAETSQEVIAGPV